MSEKKIPHPPKWADRFLIGFCAEDVLETLQGDLHELYAKRTNTQGKRLADFHFVLDVLSACRPFAFNRKKQRSPYSNNFTMFQHYFKISWRNLLKNKGYSFINIGGLATGMAVTLLIALWIYDELTFNEYHQNHSHIAQVLRNGTLNGETFTTSYLPYALGDELKNKYGNNFKHVVMSWSIGDHILSFDDKKFSQKGTFIESAAPEMFSFNMIHGTLDGLKDLNSILISASTAKRLFGDENPIGKPLMIDNRMNAEITGVYEDFPHNSHFYEAMFFAPWDLFETVNNWMTTQGFTNNFLDIYVEIPPTTNFETASENIKDAILNNVQHLNDYVAVNPQIFLQPMDKWHLYSEWENGVNTGGRILFVWLFGIIGAFVLLLACINFMNLSTARSEKRAKEVGIRKTIGSLRGQIIHQFFSESFLIVFLAFCFALVLTAISLEGFNVLAGKQMELPITHFYFWIISFCFILATGFVAGSYPAFYLSSFQPVKVLKGTLHIGRGASLPRKILVVIQFTVSVTLIIGTIVVYQQIQYAKDRPVGYNRDGLIMIQITTPEFYGKFEVLETELKKTGAISEIAESASPVTGVWSSNGGFEWRDKDPLLQAEFATLSVTPEYGKTVGWEFVNGRDFIKDFAADSTGLILNESAAKLLGFENPLGEVVRWKPVWKNAVINFTVQGVIRDMIMQSPYKPPMPTIFFLSDNYNWINIKINPAENTHDALAKIEAVFKELIPSAPFDYKFADQEYALKFEAEERVGKLASVFAVLAIFISCLGLFGLASFVAEQRTKEIGIRKVLGASVINLWQMMSKDFVLLVIISWFIAMPVSYYIMSKWLENYEYQTDIPWYIFAFTGLGALAIALLTVSFQAIKAAMANPINSLKTE